MSMDVRLIMKILFHLFSLKKFLKVINIYLTLSEVAGRVKKLARNEDIDESDAVEKVFNHPRLEARKVLNN